MKNLKTTGLVFFCVLCGSLMFASPIELTGGDLKLILYPDTGSFSLLKLSEVGKNRYESLFEDRNFSTTSWFSVMVNGRIFKLAKKPGKPIVAEQTVLGARFVFTLTDDFQVEQLFSFINNSTTGTPRAVLITTRIENTSGKPGVFALKALFDTMLGESEGIHFTTNIQKRISSETRIVTAVNPDNVIISQNKNLSCAFYLYGSGASRPDTVYISNWERLNTLTWFPDFVEGRSFNTLYSVNDSALLFVWPEKTLQANDKLSVSMVLGPFSSDISSSSSSVSKSAASATVVPVDAASTQATIQQLLDRIAEIEANPGSASDDELIRLNNDLDTMLQQIKE